MPDPAGLAAAAYSDPFPSAARHRVLVYADQFGASQSIAFVEGLAGARAAGEAAARIVEEAAFGPDIGPRGAGLLGEMVQAELDQVGPTAIVLSRFGHSAACTAIAAAAAARNIPLLAHLDDELFDLPVTAGIERYRAARHPRRLEALQRSLAGAALVIASTQPLAERLARKAGHARVGWLENGTAGRPRPRRAKADGAPVVIGYMGSASHAADLEMVVPALNALRAGRPMVRLELFGSIARQPAADLLHGAVERHDAVLGDYSAFRARLDGLGWDIGIAPLQAAPFNRCKTATKWAEYAEAGAAVLASDIEVYRPMFAAEAAMPAGPEQWTHALERLVESPALRGSLVAASDRLLRASYGWDRLEASLLALLERARPLRAAA